MSAPRVVVLAVVASLCGAGGVVAPATVAARPPAALVTLAGEGMSAGPTRVARPLRERAAQGGWTMMLSGGVALRGGVTLAQPADRVVLRVRAKRCVGWPVLRVALDGRLIQNRHVTSSRYATVAIRRRIAAGEHRLTVAMTHSAVGPGCRRRLYVDTVRLTTAAPVRPGGKSGGSGSATPGAAGSGTATGGTTSATSTTNKTNKANTTTTTTTTTTPAPPAPGGGGNPDGLRWAPPALVNPATISVPDGDQWYLLDNARDYVVKLPAGTHNGSLGIQGGRNVVVMGGHLRLPAASGEEAALQLRDNAGTVHVEGLWVDGSSGHAADAIRISSPAAVVQLENVRASGLRGSAAGAHTDVIQPYGGVRALRVDRLTGDSNYQGIFAMPDLGPIGSVDLSRVDLSYANVLPADGGYLLWLSNGCSAPVTTLSEVYVKPGAAKTLGTSVWPNVYDATCPAKLSGNTASWPSLPVTGHVTGGTPRGGPFVTTATAGAGYVSPGYR